MRRITVGPINGLAGFVVKPYVLHQLVPEIRRRDEDAARDHIALNIGESEV